MKNIQVSPSQRGLTLVELTLAIGLSGILLTAIYSMLHASATSWRRIQERGRLYQTGRSILSRIEQDLDRAVPIKTMPFKGDERSLTFLSLSFSRDIPQFSSLDHNGNENQSRVITQVQYRVRTGVSSEEADLVRIERVLIPGDSLASSQTAVERQWKDIKNIRFSYAYASTTGTDWRNIWNAAHQTPQGVKIRLELQSPDAGEKIALEKTIHILIGQLGQPG